MRNLSGRPVRLIFSGLLLLLGASPLFGASLPWECFASKTDLTYEELPLHEGQWKSAAKSADCFPDRSDWYVFYRTRLPAVESTDPYGIYLGRVGEVHEVWLNDRVVGRTGNFPPNYLNLMHRRSAYVLGPAVRLSGEELVVKTYSEYPVTKGIRLSEVRYAPFDQLQTLSTGREMERTLAMPMLMALFVIAAAITLGLWALNRKQAFHLWAGLSALSMASYTFFLSRYGYEFELSNLFVYRGLVGSVMLVTTCLTFFALSFVQTSFSPLIRIAGFLNTGFLIYALTTNGSVLDLRADYQLWYFLFVLVLALIFAHFHLAREFRSDVKYIYVGTFVFFLFVFNDITIAMGLRSGVNISHYGMGIFATVFIITEMSTLLSDLKKSIAREAVQQGEVKMKDQIADAVLTRSRQVAHDIRSPLAALEMVVHGLPEIADEDRSLVRQAVGRIKEITNDLVRPQDLSQILGSRIPSEEPVAIEHQLVVSSVESSVLEKKRELNDPKMTISLKTSETSVYSFARFAPKELKRILSNLINNSLEARDAGRPIEVVVSIQESDDWVLIRVSDNGKGIPKEVLGRLTQKGMSFGKEAGQGLGLHHARRTIESWGGGLKILSQLGQGTTVELKLVRVEPPRWFVSSLEFEPELRYLVFLDDDENIHEVWRRRLKYLEAEKNGLKVYAFRHHTELSRWVAHHKPDLGETLFLLDYELKGQAIDGLKIAEALHITDRSILVTGRSDELKLVQEVKRLKMRMLPKALASVVPIGWRKEIEAHAIPTI